MRKNILWILALICFQQVNAQTDSVAIKKSVVAFSPQHLFFKGIRIYYDTRISQKHWLQFSPEIYMAVNAKNSFSNASYRDLYGIGIAVHDRNYINKINHPGGLYLSYGISYNYFKLTYDIESTDSYTQEHTTIQKVGGDVLIGYQFVLFSKLILDAYTGLGLNYSMREYSGIEKRSFNSDMADYGYTGSLLLAGIRLGLTF